MKKNTPYLSAGIFCGIFFLLLSFAIKYASVDSQDVYTITFIQSIIPKAMDRILSFFSLLGSFEILTLVLVLLYVLKGKKTEIEDFFFYGVGLGVELIGKLFIFHPGPPSQFFRYDIPFFFPTAYFQTGHSYPSGHSFRTAFLAIIVFFLIWESRKMSAPIKTLVILFLIAFSATMFVSRISLGEHWPSDVIGGALLGFAFAFFSEHTKHTTRIYFPNG